MADHSKIEWTDASWTPIRARNRVTGKVGWHCEHATTGCEFCYSEGFNLRLGTGLPFKPGHRKDIEIFLDEEMLTAPLRWKKPRRIFVCSMTDLFADFVEDRWIDAMLSVMRHAKRHTFQILTKRAERLHSYFGKLPQRELEWDCDSGLDFIKLPLPNVWLGVSCERQQEYDERNEHLRNTPAAVHFFSMEPLLGPIVGDYLGDWIIVGGESGKNARPMHPDWARSLRDQCAAAGVPYFFKQHGEWREPQNDENYDTSFGRTGKPPAFIIANDGTVHCYVGPGMYAGKAIIRVGKKAAGRFLDGVEHNGFPSQIRA